MHWHTSTKMNKTSRNAATLSTHQKSYADSVKSARIPKSLPKENRVTLPIMLQEHNVTEIYLLGIRKTSTHRKFITLLMHKTNICASIYFYVKITIGVMNKSEL